MSGATTISPLLWKLSNEAKELLKQFDALTGDSLHAVEKASGEQPKEKPGKKKKLF